jgi:Tol biopolymer transport system component
MNRTLLGTGATGIILPALVALLPGCDEPFTCPAQQIDCVSVCVDLTTDRDNCGACGEVCGPGFSCMNSACTADISCTAPEVACGTDCADLQTSAAHCGDCDTACSTHGDCVTGDCAEPLAVMQTSLMDRTVDRDLFVLRDLTYTLTRLDESTFATSRVIDHAILPDGNILLVAAQTEGVFELWLASPRGGTLTRVNGTLAAGGDVEPGIVVSRDGRKVLYRADQDTDDVIDLYAVSLASPGTSVKVNGTLTAGGAVSRVFALSASGDRAAYIADQDTDNLNEAYTVDLSAATPGASVKLNPATTDPVWDLVMSPDGARVVYRQENSSVGRVALQVVATASPGVATEVTYTDGAEGHVEAYRLTPDGSAVVFTGGNGFLEESLWHAPLAAPDGTRLADGRYDTISDYHWVRADFAVSADGARVYFRKVAGGFGFDRLFRVDVAAPEVLTQLSPAGDTSAEEVTDFALASGGAAIVFRGGADGAEGGSIQPGTDPPVQDVRHAPAIYHIDLAATAPPAPTLLSPVQALNSEGIGDGYVVTADGSRTIYRADQEQVGFSDAYLAELATAGTVRKVSPPLDQASDSTDVSLLTRF